MLYSSLNGVSIALSAPLILVSISCRRTDSSDFVRFSMLQSDVYTIYTSIHYDLILAHYQRERLS